MKKRFFALGALSVSLMLVFMTTAFAWPEQPPTKAFISGAGIQGELQITEENVLSVLRLGGFEDFQHVVPAPKMSAQGYKITRYFENGTFRMGDLTYYPRAMDGKGVALFQDGDMKHGDRSPYDQKWYLVLPHSEQVLQNYLRDTANVNLSLPLWFTQNRAGARETIAFDAQAKRARFILPRGLRSADGNAYWSAFHSGGMTALHSFDVADGSIRASLGLEGTWELGAVSATGKWIALKRVASESERAAPKTTIALIDAQTLQTTRTLSLDGNFDVDALDARGSALYLIQHLPVNNPDHYQVRLYDLALGQLQDGAIVDKRNVDEVMAGYPSTQVAAPDGQWLFTLYVGMQEGHAFIHALNLRERYAWCIDLPSGDGDSETLEHYALALAPDGHTIYASNAVLGVLTQVDVMNIGEPRVIQFPPFANKTDAPMADALVSNDGARVFLSDARTVWQYDVATLRTQELKRGTMPILGLALNSDASELLLAYADHSVTAVTLLTNTQASVTNSQNKNACPVTHAPAQLFVPPAPYPPKAPYGDFWYGNEKLWTALRPDGKWYALPLGGQGYSQKLVWWREGYVGTSELQPALKITGKQLDGTKTFAVAGATNAQSSDFGGNGWAIMSGVEIPALGCWEITGEYGGQKLSFVVEVTP